MNVDIYNKAKPQIGQRWRYTDKNTCIILDITVEYFAYDLTRYKFNIIRQVGYTIHHLNELHFNSVTQQNFGFTLTFLGVGLENLEAYFK